MSIVLLLLRYLWPFILIGGVYWWADEGWCNGACKKHQAAEQAAMAKLAKAEADQRAIAALWKEDADRAQAEASKRAETDHAQFAALQAKASALQARVVTLSGELNRVLADAVNAANAAPAPQGNSPPSAPVPVTYTEQDIAKWVTAAAEAYKDAVSQWQSCVNFYTGLGHELAP